jgi:hypothetical protein
LGSIFFGLPSNYKEIILEEHYILMRHLQVGYLEVRNMPRRYRQWFIERYVTELKNQKEAQEAASNKSKR